MSIINKVESVVNRVSQAISNKVSEAKSTQTAAKTTQAGTNDNSAGKAGASETDEVSFSDRASSIADKAGKQKNDVVSLEDQLEDGQEAIYARGGEDNDSIGVKAGDDGSLVVNINGEETTYSAEEAKRLIIDAGAGDDEITVDENVKQGLRLTGGEGDDKIVGGSGNDAIIDNYGSNEINGGDGDDTILSTGKTSSSWLGRLWNSITGDKPGNSTIEGGRGNDIIVTGDGNDVVTDAGGENAIFTRGGADKINLEYGTNTVDSGDGDDNIEVAGGQSVIHAGKGDDTITTGRGDDAIYAGKGNDSISSGAGNDYIEGGDGEDKIDAGADQDVVYSGKGNDSVNAGEGNDYVDGGKGDDKIVGEAGNDVIFGGRGNDSIDGGDDDDTIVGGYGKDKLAGGAGADNIVRTEGFNKNDSVSSDDADSVTTTNPISVPLNFVVNPFGGEGFSERINSDLEALASIELGQNLLNNIADTGKIVAFTSLDEQNGYACPWRGAAASSVDADGNPGSGCSTTIKINPSFRSLYGKSQDWSETPPIVTMAHEMSHAYNNATGTKDWQTYNHDTGEIYNGEGREIKGAEFQAVGIHDDWVSSPNPEGCNENDYREFFHMEKRTSYLRN